MRLFLLFVLFSVVLSCTSCKKYVAADAAFFIKPTLVSVATTPSQGSGNSKITDLWVYVDGQFKGAYPVDNTIPIVSKGRSVTLDIFAGIKNNGIKDTRTFWPFYQSLKIDTLVESGKTIERRFTFAYNSSTTFTWTESFESLPLTVNDSPKSDATYTTMAGGESLEGRYLYLSGNSSDNIFSIESYKEFTLPTGDPNVYLELNYKCNSDVLIGLLTSAGEEKEAFHLNPQSNWNKIYISLASTVNAQPASARHKVFFRMVKTNANVIPELYLDNIKLVYL